jgi:hypothetical protein
LALLLIPIAVDARGFRKGDKVVNKSTGEIYTFQYDADIGVFEADSGLGSLFLIDGKVYTITDKGVESMKSACKKLAVTEADLKAAKKKHSALYKRYMKLLKAYGKEQAKVKDLESELEVSKKMEESLTDVIWMQKTELGNTEAELESLHNVINTARSSLQILNQKLYNSEMKSIEELSLMKSYLIMVSVFSLFVIFFGAMHIYGLHKSVQTEEGIIDLEEEIEVIDLTELGG